MFAWNVGDVLIHTTQAHKEYPQCSHIAQSPFTSSFLAHPSKAGEGAQLCRQGAYQLDAANVPVHDIQMIHRPWKN